MNWLCRKTILLVIILCLGGILQAQTEKKPTLMILPSDNWCTQRFFTTVYEFQGVKTRVPNYQQAFQEDTELSQVISMVGQIHRSQVGQRPRQQLCPWCRLPPKRDTTQTIPHTARPTIIVYNQK